MQTLKQVLQAQIKKYQTDTLSKALNNSILNTYIWVDEMAHIIV